LFDDLSVQDQQENQNYRPDPWYAYKSLMLAERYRSLEMLDFTGVSLNGEVFEIEGINIWLHGWQVQDGQGARVEDSAYGQDLTFHIYTIQDGK
jgi:hypothetical protein